MSGVGWVLSRRGVLIKQSIRSASTFILQNLAPGLFLAAVRYGMASQAGASAAAGGAADQGGLQHGRDTGRGGGHAGCHGGGGWGYYDNAFDGRFYDDRAFFNGMGFNPGFSPFPSLFMLGWG